MSQLKKTKQDRRVIAIILLVGLIGIFLPELLKLDVKSTMYITALIGLLLGVLLYYKNFRIVAFIAMLGALGLLLLSSLLNI